MVRGRCVNTVNITSMSCSVSNAHIAVRKFSVGLNTTVHQLTVALTINGRTTGERDRQCSMKDVNFVH